MNKGIVPSALNAWQFDFAAPRGLSLSYDGVPIIRQSALFVVKPGWTGVLFDHRSQKYAIQRDGGALNVVGDGENFRAEYRLEALDEHTFRLRFKGELKRDVPASIEYAAGYFNANLLANRSFEAQTARGRRSGRVPAFPVTSEQLANDLAPNFQSLEFDSRLGKLRVEARSASRVVFFDARRDPQDWAKSAPIFWCGWLAGMQPLRPGTPVELELLISLDPAPIAPRQALTLRPVLRPVAAAQSARERPIEIIPRPQKLRIDATPPFVLNRDTRISLLMPRGETRVSRALQNLLRQEFGLPKFGLPIAAPRLREHDGKATRIVLSGTRPPRFAAAPPSAPTSGTAAASWRNNAEGYRLRANESGIEISASTAQGAFYGVQTLRQLLRSERDGATCPAVLVEDWPALTFRGAHWFPSASGVPFHKKLIERVLARHKFNAAVIQCEAARWDAAPAIAAPNSISKADLRALVQLCRDNFIEPIPLINLPGHAEWMFRNGQNLDLAEDPQAPYAYAVRNPRSLPFAQQILGEAIEVFRPKIFHLGHDEVTMRGRFPNPQNPFYQAGVSAGDLVLENLSVLHNWLKTRDIKTMIWGDMLLARAEGVDAAGAPDAAEAQRRRSLVPRDVLIADWHYGSNQNYPSLDLFRASGLQTIAATWYSSLNIRHFARAAQAAGARGILQTTWAGYFPDETVLASEARQFAAFVLAGDYAWSNRDEMPAALPYDAMRQWSRAYNDAMGEQNRPGVLVDLAPAARVAATDWLSLGNQWDLEEFFEAATPPAHRHDDVLFAPAPRHLVVLAAAAARELASPGSLAGLNLEINRRFSAAALLHAALWATPNGTKAARLIAQYSDGTQSTLELIQGRNLTAWTQENGAPEAARAWTAASSRNRPGPPPSLFVTRWANPHPEKIVARLRLEPLAPEAGWALAGLTLLD